MKTKEDLIFSVVALEGTLKVEGLYEDTLKIMDEYADIQNKALKDFINSIAIYKENDGKRELTAIKLSDFEKLKELYNKIKF